MEIQPTMPVPSIRGSRLWWIVTNPEIHATNTPGAARARRYLPKTQRNGNSLLRSSFSIVLGAETMGCTTNSVERRDDWTLESNTEERYYCLVPVTEQRVQPSPTLTQRPSSAESLTGVQTRGYAGRRILYQTARILRPVFTLQCRERQLQVVVLWSRTLLRLSRYHGTL